MEKKSKKMKIYSMQFFSFLFLICLLAVPALAEGYQVIANPNLNAQTISKDEVRQILLTNLTQWSGTSISIVTLAPGVKGSDEISKEFMGMTSIQAKKHWLIKVFGGVIPSAPLTGETEEEVIATVLKIPGAIAVLPKSVNPGKAKVVEIK